MTVRRDPFESQVADGVLVIRVHAPEMKAPEAERLIEIVFDDFEGDQVVLNVTEVEYINSTVMSALSRVSVAKDMRIVGLRTGVQDILETMGLLQFLELSATEDEARKSLAEG